MRNALVDLWDLLEENREQVEEIDEFLDELVEEAKENYGDFETVREEAPAIIQNYEEQLERRDKHKQMADGLEERLEAYEENPVIEDPEPGEESGWEDTTFHVRELSIGDLGRIEDLTGTQIENTQDAIETSEGAAMVESLRLAIKRSPEGAPDNPANLPVIVAEPLMRYIGKLSGMSNPEEMGNSSLRERMEH